MGRSQEGEVVVSSACAQPGCLCFTIMQRGCVVWLFGDERGALRLEKMQVEVNPTDPYPPLLCPEHRAEAEKEAADAAAKAAKGKKKSEGRR